MTTTHGEFKIIHEDELTIAKNSRYSVQSVTDVGDLSSSDIEALLGGKLPYQTFLTTSMSSLLIVSLALQIFNLR